MYLEMSSMSKADSQANLKKSSVNYKNYVNKKIALNKLLGGVSKVGRFNSTFDKKSM